MKGTIQLLYDKLPEKSKTRGADKYIVRYFSTICNNTKISDEEKCKKQLNFEHYLLKNSNKGTYWNKLDDIPDIITDEYILSARKKSVRFKQGII